MLREIVIYPDKRLKLISKEVESFDNKLHTLLDDMYETMLSKHGVGLAAIQIAEAKRVLIINVPLEVKEGEEDQPKANTLEMINPVIVEYDGIEKFQEGCLSVPGFYEDIERYKYVKVSYRDRYGIEQSLESNNFLAIAIQHEMDHLEGKLFVERLSFLKRKKFEKEWKRFQK